MSKSVKRNDKYNDYEEDRRVYDHRKHLQEKHLKSALRAKNHHKLIDMYEEDEF